MSCGNESRYSDFAVLQRRIRADFVDGEEQLVVLRRQFRQRLPLSRFRWPADELLRDYEVQQWIFRVFKEHVAPRSSVNDLANPYNNTLISKWQKDLWAEFSRRVEVAVENADEPDIFDPLMEESASHCRASVRSDAEEAQKDVWITYEFGDMNMLLESASVHLLERPRLLSDASSTGHRTWEAALALADEIATSWLPRNILRGKKVLELGAGTGLLSFLCGLSHHLSRPLKVIGTDGSRDVVQRLRENNIVNGNSTPNPLISFGDYTWGEPFEGTIIGEELLVEGFDFVLAADVTYSPLSIPALVATLTQLFEKNGKAVTCIFSAVVRNKETFDLFLRTCEAEGIHAHISIPQDIVQTSFFHPNRECIRFIKLSSKLSSHTNPAPPYTV